MGQLRMPHPQVLPALKAAPVQGDVLTEFLQCQKGMKAVLLVQKYLSTCQAGTDSTCKNSVAGLIDIVTLQIDSKQVKAADSHAACDLQEVKPSWFRKILGSTQTK